VSDRSCALKSWTLIADLTAIFHPGPKSAVPKSAAFDSTRHNRSRKPVGLSRPSQAPLLSRVRQPALPLSITLPQTLKSNHAWYVPAPPPDRAPIAFSGRKISHDADFAGSPPSPLRLSS
jgi:hypothetical protein